MSELGTDGKKTCTEGGWHEKVGHLPVKVVRYRYRYCTVSVGKVCTVP